jgi:hypothetical protein
LPKSLTSKIKIDKLRVYFTANNLLTVAKSDLLKDYDPERGLPTITAQGAITTQNYLPMSRQFIFGINLDF